MIISLLLLSLGGIAPASPQQPILTCNTGFEIHPLIFDVPGGTWGPEFRPADHATVAINSVGDIAVAYHTTRDDIVGHPPLKQVEVALFRYNVLRLRQHFGRRHPADPAARPHDSPGAPLLRGPQHGPVPDRGLRPRHERHRPQSLIL